MAEYLFYKLERFRPEGGDHINNQVKYWCEQIYPEGTVTKVDKIEFQGVPQHPYTDDNPNRLFNQIAKLYNKGDKVYTLEKEEISTGPNGLELELKVLLSHDEMRILTVAINYELSKK